MKQPCVYIMASKRHGTLYTGVTANLPRRAFEHREGLLKGFSTKYGCKILVWYELHESMIEAIAREKQIKAGSRGEEIGLDRRLKSRMEGPLRVAGMRLAAAFPPSLRAKRSNPCRYERKRMDCFVAALLAMTKRPE
jgi:predicted GIY-YIG superfamily endonuclease